MPVQDLRFAVRMLRKSPVFTLTAAITIALGVGASTAIFGVTNTVLLKPLPYSHPHQLVVACADFHARGVRDQPFSNENFIDLRDGTTSVFQGLAGVYTDRLVLFTADGRPEQVHYAMVTTNFFDLMGAKIAYGRDFTPQDGMPQRPPAAAGTLQSGGAQPRLQTMAILSYGYFERRYGGNPSVMGKTIQTEGEFGPMAASSPVIVGVLAPGFRLYFPPQADTDREPEVWIASRLDYDNANRNYISIHAVGRLKPRVSLEEAQAAADNVAAEARKDFLIERGAGYAIRLEPIGRNLVSEIQPTILALMGAVIFLLLIACANVANLLLVRASLRERELAVRAAMGATRWHLMGQMLAEALLLVLLGAAGGLALAWAGIRELLAAAPANLPRMEAIGIDSEVLGFTALVALVAASCGLVSAWRASRPNLAKVLGGSVRTEGLRGGGLLRRLVVVMEVALCFVLLVGAGLMARSFRDLQQINPGFDARGLLTFQIQRNPGRTTQAARAAAVRQIEQRLGAIPGVERVTASDAFPLSDEGFGPMRWGTPEARADAGKFHAADAQFVLPGYFETMRIPLLAGRTFTESDNQPGRKVVMIDEELKKRAFPQGSAIGKQILVLPDEEPVEVIGVVAHLRDETLSLPGREQLYLLDAFAGSGIMLDWAVRTNGGGAKYAGEVRSAIKDVDPQLLVTGMESADSVVERAEASTRFSLLLIGVFAVIATPLAAVGLYGVLSTVVRQRTAEIGVRMALGAQRREIFRLIVGHALRLTGLGIAAGLAAALLLTRLMGTMLVGVSATDPATFVAMAILFFAIAGAAAWLPARRAAGLDPSAALREP